MSVASLTRRFPKYPDWEMGKGKPTWRQVEILAKKTLTPFGYLFLPEPPREALPIPDFRTVSDTHVMNPSPNLLDTVHTMQRRQDWMRETLLEEGAEPLGFAGSACLNDNPAVLAAKIRSSIGLVAGWAHHVHTWQDAVGELRRAIENSGVMAVINGVVGNNTHRTLDVNEFRGFALCDPFAPLIFVNGADAKSAQMFTLAHELVHIWIGLPGVSGFEGLEPGENEVEIFCNTVAAEFLIPAEELQRTWSDDKDAPQFELIARRFKVSPVVAARRAMDLHLISRKTFFRFYAEYQQDERQRKSKRSGGDFYLNQNNRVGERFAGAVFRAAKEGRLLYRDAYALTGLYGKTFDSYSRHLGYDVL